MTTLSILEKEKLEKLFEMSSGYVLNFSDTSLRQFILHSVNIDIDDAKYKKFGTSKANRLRALWQVESNEIAGKLTEDIIHSLLDEDSAVNNNYDKTNQNLANRCLDIALKLQEKEKVESPQSQNVEDFLQMNVGDVEIGQLALDKQLIFVLEQRITEVKKCLTAQAPLSAIFLCGSILEGLLLGIASKKPKEFNQSLSSPKDAVSGKVKHFHEWTLNNLIDVAEEIGYISLDVKKYSHSLRDFRNYIHPSLQISSKFEPDMHTAKISWQVLRSAINQIFEKMK